MNPDFYLCDICGGKLPEKLRFFVTTGRSWNGVENEDDGEHVDLCHTCAVAALQELLTHAIGPGPAAVDEHQGKRLLAWVKRRKTK